MPRVTNEMLINSFLRDLQRSTEALSKAREEIASGVKVRTPSDDPAKASRILSFRSTISRMKQEGKNADYAVSQLKATDDVLDNIADVLLRAKDLTLETINSKPEAHDRKMAAVEINQLLEYVLQAANSSFMKKPIFAGTKTDVTPFVAVRSGEYIKTVQYQGNSEQRYIDVGFGARINLNVPGTSVFFMGGKNLFEVLADLRDALQEGNTKQLNDLINQLDRFYERVDVVRTEIGAKIQRAQTVKDRLDNATQSLSELLAHEEDVDMTEVLTRYRLYENVLMATMASGARLLNLSLLNFMR